MNPGNDGALHSMLCDYAEYDEFPVRLGDEEVTVYHSQYAKYPVERAARALHEGLSFSPAEYDDYGSLRDAIFEDVHEEVTAVIEETPGLHVGIHDESLFDEGQYIGTTDMHGEVTRLVRMYDGFEPGDDAERHYELYGEGRRVPETRAQFVADLLTMYNILLAERHLDDLRFTTYDEEWSEDEAFAALYAMRDAVEREHGWSVFSAPSPEMEEVTAIWQMMEEVGFPKEGAVDWAYALYILPHGAKKYEMRDGLDRKMRHSMGETMARAMREEVGENPAPRGLRWAAEDTSEAELDAHKEEMRERWEAEHLEESEE